MTTWECKVVDAAGRRSVVVRSAETKEWVLRDLHQEGLFVLAVKLQQGQGVELKGIPAKEVLAFTRTLATLMGNGLTLRETLEVASRIPLSRAQNRLVVHLSSSVGKGQSLHESLVPWGKVFGPFYRGMVRIGERSGDLAPVLAQLTDYLASRQVLREKTGNAMLYPLFVLGVAALGLTLLALFVFPALLEVVTSVNAEAAKAYAATIETFRISAFWWLVAVAALGAIGSAALWRARSDAAWAQTLGQWSLLIPVWKNLRWSMFGWNFSFALETLLQAGATVEEALAEAAAVEANPYIRSVVLNARERVIDGETLSMALSRTVGFPPTIVAWVAVGEGAHDLKQSFAQLKNQYRQTVDSFHSRYLSMVEPALIVLVGAALVFLILNFVTPFFQMMGKLV